ncbi:MAG: hypothetical protein JWN14_766 [Chthonomonadales bacterium]|nr:hypothetical protein [Chthonomonadales bacterium]
MTDTMTLGQVEELVVALPLPDQQRLIERISERLEAQPDYIARAEAFLKTCLENPVRPIAVMNAGEETAAMRAERGDDLS